MIDSRTQTLVPLRSAAPLFPAGNRPAFGTLHRYSLKGARHRFNKDRFVRLETLKIGGKLVTSQEAVDSFIVALSTPDEPHFVTPGQRASQDAAATKVLQAAGVL